MSRPYFRVALLFERQLFSVLISIKKQNRIHHNFSDILFFTVFIFIRTIG